MGTSGEEDESEAGKSGDPPVATAAATEAAALSEYAAAAEAQARAIGALQRAERRVAVVELAGTEARRVLAALRHERDGAGGGGPGSG